MSKSGKTSKTFGQLIVTDASATKLGSTSRVSLRKTSPAVVVATGSSTLTGAQTVSGLISQTPAANSTLTLPSAASLITQFGSVSVGDTFNVTLINGAAATFTTTLAVPASGTLVGSGIVAPLGTQTFAVRFTNVTAASEAYTVYTI